MQTIKIFYLGGPGCFEYVVSSLPHGADEWRVEIRGERPTNYNEVLDEELVEYANCRDEIEAVKRYINKYGPPDLIKQDDSNLLYADFLSSWRSRRRQFRETWDRMLGIEIKNEFTETFGKAFPELWKAQPPWERVTAEGHFRVAEHGLIFEANRHDSALVIKLLAVSAAGKLRKCLNPSCPYTPYFIADHGKTQYCSAECGKWGQRQAKLKYWRDNKQTTQDVSKPSFAQSEASTMKKIELRRKDGAQKTR